MIIDLFMLFTVSISSINASSSINPLHLIMIKVRFVSKGFVSYGKQYI